MAIRGKEDDDLRVGPCDFGWAVINGKEEWVPSFRIVLGRSANDDGARRLGCSKSTSTSEASGSDENPTSDESRSSCCYKNMHEL